LPGWLGLRGLWVWLDRKGRSEQQALLVLRERPGCKGVRGSQARLELRVRLVRLVLPERQGLWGRLVSRVRLVRLVRRV
jgi:hypothetical protein